MDKACTQTIHSPDHLPVSIITGFLGSGKTTLLNYLVQQPEMQNVVVLINEFGEIGIDHLLIETITDEIILLQSGCICCQMNGDFVSTLTDLYERRITGEVERFDHVLVETTGIADPAPIIHSLLSDAQLVPRYRLATIVTTVDTVLGNSQLREQRESAKQIIFADKLLFTKSDLSDQSTRESLTTMVRQLNPEASISEVVNGEIAPSEIFTQTTIKKNRDISETTRWLGVENISKRAGDDQSGISAGHADAITTFSVTLDRAIAWPDFVEWIEELLFSRSRQILRIKGILNIDGGSGPTIFQAVQHMLYPPRQLTNWPDEQRQSILVFITYNLSRTAIETSLSQFFEDRYTSGMSPIEARA